MVNQIRTLIADDNPRSRSALRAVLNLQPECVVVGEAAGGAAAVALARCLRPHVVLMDIEMPGIDGVMATRILKLLCPDIVVIGLSMYSVRHDEMIAAGAAACLSKTEPLEDLLTALASVSTGAAGESIA